MRNRHYPRLCHACKAPMAAHEDTCWRCRVAWTAERPRVLRVISGGVAPDPKPAQVPGAATAERLARLVAEVRG